MKTIYYIVLLAFISCQKQVKETQPTKSITAQIVTLQSRVAASSKKDTDKDGIYDATDLCPKVKETFNGYLDTDGCPDEIPPPPPPADYDGDGISDALDKCPSEKENYNSFQDEDGCPDTPIITLPTIDLPASAELLTPIPGRQGNEGSCVAFACTYGARSIEQYYKTGATFYDNNANVFSPEYTYNQSKFGECATGTSVDRVMQIMINQGVCVLDIMPYSDINGCSVLPDATQISNAANYKINGYAKMSPTDRTAIKQMIFTKHPVIITVIADNSFVNAKTGFVWRTYSGSGALPHTLLICGYDDSKNAYKVFNSWGTDWCDGGFGWIDYDFFPTKSSFEVYVIQ
jgi:hypothetical protein